MATTTPQTEALEAWLRSNGAYLHPSIRISHSDESGIHLHATEDIPPGTALASTPHRLALSYLNALVDDAYPFLKQLRHRFKVEVLGYFYLMTQYVNREQSFWKPYLDALPSPESDLTQPVFFDNADDIAWLKGTDAWHTVSTRRGTYEAYYQHGIACVQESGVDIEPYTWHLFLWAVSMYTSRSFSSRTLRPQSGKYWAAYKTSSQPGGIVRQAVLLDMSSASAEDLHFPVLFPGLDAANHSPSSKVDWTFDPGLFSIALAKPGESDGIKAGDEVFNNYGPKGNGELLIGYGFCILGNPYDHVSMVLNNLPPELQENLETVHPGYFNQQGIWDPVKARFDLRKPDILPQTTSGLAQRPQIFYQLPEPLLELLLYITRHERHMPFTFEAHPLSSLTDQEGNSHRLLPHLAHIIAGYLAPRLKALQSTTPSQVPQNRRQEYASIYRNGQLDITTRLLTALKTYLGALIYTTPGPAENPKPLKGNVLLSLASFVGLLNSHDALDRYFMKGIKANANTSDFEQLRLAGWEEDVWVLLISWLHFSLPKLPPYLRDALYRGGHTFRKGDTRRFSIEQATDLLGVVEIAKASYASWWEWGDWSAEWIAQTGGSMVAQDGFMIDEKGTDGDQDERRFFMHLFFE